MPLTFPDLQALKTDITVTRAATVYQGQTLLQWWTAGADGTLASFYNQVASPVVPLWNPKLSTTTLIDSLVGTEVIALSQGQRDLFAIMTRFPFIDATQAQVRTNFATAVGGGSVTIANWTAKARKNGTYFETLYITSTTGGASITAHYGSICRPDDISDARRV